MKAIMSFPVMAAMAVSVGMVLLGYTVTVLPSWRKRFWALPGVFQKLYVFFFMAPVVLLPMAPQPRYELGWGISATIGNLLIGMAVVIWISALWQMRGIPSVRKSTGLVVGGIYGVVRNPIYTANFLILPGLGMVFHSLAALLYTPVWFFLLAGLCVLEERGLKEQYGEEFDEYMKSVPYRLVVYMF
jgi:protein-S-isoprenylcysteine O-methyltransferase Ste14